MNLSRGCIYLVLVTLWACGEANRMDGGTVPPDSGITGPDSGSAVPDSGVPLDGGNASDGGGLTDGGSMTDGGTAVDGGSMPDGGFNFVFITSGMHSANFGGLDVADAFCQAYAADAGLPGTYRAWLATNDGGPALWRLGNARGWLRTDGKPFTDTTGALLTLNQQFYPLSLNEHGVHSTQSAWTGVAADGGVGATCADWTSADAGLSGQVGTTGEANYEWTTSVLYACSSNLSLYCFGVDAQNPVAPQIPTPHRLAFVTAGSYVLDGGLTQADALCASEATGAGLSGTYVAVLSTDAGSAWSRFDATTGGPWLRIDGAALKPSAAELLGVDGGALDTALNVTPSGIYLGAGGTDSVWSGSVTPAVPSASAGILNDCDDWTNPSAFAQGVGNVEATASSTWWDFVAFGSPCSTPHHLYCMER